MNRCGTCRNNVIVYDYDHNLDCYLGPVNLDPTPLTLDLAIACLTIGRGLYTHHTTRTGRRRISRIWPHHPHLRGDLIPTHQCGATTPTALPPRTRTTVPDLCPF